MSHNKESNQKFYITTSINSTNDHPHIGHAYEVICADIHARYHRIYGRNVYFLTGTDEHGQMIDKSSKSKNMSPIELCDKYSLEFQELNKRLNISSDHFIRTTSSEHCKLVQSLFQKLLDKGDIYLGVYNCWYDKTEKKFLSENEASWNEYRSRSNYEPLIKMEEEIYYFALSKYKDRLLDHINSNPDFIYPQDRREFILKQLRDNLRDIRVSTKNIDFGIQVLNNADHIIAPWFDSLLNYLTGTNYPSEEFNQFWPPSLQIMERNITWLHAVIWPCLLLSLELAIPKRIFGHGFVNDHIARKIPIWALEDREPNILLDQYPSDSLRLSLIHSNQFGNDILFSKEKLVRVHNSDLAATIGNLVNRCATLLSKYANGKIPDVRVEEIFNFENVKEESEKLFEKSDIYGAYELAIQSIKQINSYLTSRAPWKIKDEEDLNFEKRNVIVKSALNSIYITAHFLEPFIPETAEKIFQSFSERRKTINSLTLEGNLSVGTVISSYKFEKLEKV